MRPLDLLDPAVLQRTLDPVRCLSEDVADQQPVSDAGSALQGASQLSWACQARNGPALHAKAVESGSNAPVDGPRGVRSGGYADWADSSGNPTPVSSSERVHSRLAISTSEAAAVRPTSVG